MKDYIELKEIVTIANRRRREYIDALFDIKEIIERALFDIKEIIERTLFDIKEIIERASDLNESDKEKILSIINRF